MLQFIFHLFIALMLVVSCECKDMHVRRMPEEKDIAFKGEVKKPQKAVYRKGESREIQVHLTSSDEEAKDAQFKILSATLADGSPADLDYTSLKLGDNTLSYTPKGPGTHALTIKVAVEGEEESAQTLHYTLEAPAANWQVRGTVNDTGNLTLQVADVPDELQGESWRITNTTWSRGLRGTIADTSTLRSGDNNLQVALTSMALEEPPTLHMTVENDGEEKSMSINLRTLCITQLQEPLSEAQIQALREDNTVRGRVGSYQESYTGTDREAIQQVVGRLFEETTRLRETTTTQLENLETNLNILRHQDPEGLAVLDTRRTQLQRVLEALARDMLILQPMVTQLEASNTGRIDPYGVLYEALQQGTYDATSMASQLNSPLLKVNEKDQQDKTLLHLAIEQGNMPLSEILIEKRAEVNVKDRSGHTPLHYATAANNEEAIALLRDVGVQPYLINKFGALKWRKYFGEVGSEPPIPTHIVDLLDKDCKLFPGKKVYETHLLTLIPATIDGTPLSLNSFQKLLENLEETDYNKVKYWVYSDSVKKEFGEQVCETSYWALMTRDVLPDSKEKSYDEQCAFVEDIANTTSIPYTLPFMLEGVVSTSCYCVDTGKELLTCKSGTVSRCREKLRRGFTLAFGGFRDFGIQVKDHRPHGIEVAGMAATVR